MLLSQIIQMMADNIEMGALHH